MVFQGFLGGAQIQRTHPVEGKALEMWKSYEDAHKLLWLKLLHPLDNLRPGSLGRLMVALIVHDNSRLCDLPAWSFLESGD